MGTRKRGRGARLTARETLLFEAGIKLGGIFHQYLGIPVTGATAGPLARAIEAAVRLQPYVRSVRVAIRPSRGPPLGRGRFRYRYLTPEMLRVTVGLAARGVRVEARLAHRADLRYPLMHVVAVRDARARARAGAGPAPRSARRGGRRRGRSRRRTSPSAG